MPSRKTPVAARPEANQQRFRQALQELQQIDYFLKGTVLKRMMKCGRPQCACSRDPQAAPSYKAATKQHRKLKIVLARLERLSKAALTHLAKQADNTD